VSDKYPVIVLGGSGYVAGELLRLVGLHPQLSLGGAVSTSQAGEPVAATFAHLAPLYPDARFISPPAAADRLREAPHWVVLSAAPHGASAAMVSELMEAAETAGTQITVVDASADFRFSDPEAFAAVYKHAHPAPERLQQFVCAVPEHLPESESAHAAHPGCFATAMLLGMVPLLAAGIGDGRFYVSAVTGSTGAGRTPRETTHHPVRQSNLFAYQALAHRHAPEVCALAEAASGTRPSLHFVPHSGPFARGIHATLFTAHGGRTTASDVREALAEFYRDAPFVHVQNSPPRLKDIVASNHAVLSAAVDGDAIVVCSVLDNLLKGAAGGCIQWVNRLLGLPEPTGLIAPAPGWL
jgi:N-acetyl-gamma-glutamyl-phosphate reductase common form